jgi:hypothetical protein
MHTYNQINQELCVLINEKKIINNNSNTTRKIKTHVYIKIFNLTKHDILSGCVY